MKINPFFFGRFEKKFGFCELLKISQSAELKFNFRMPAINWETTNFSLDDPIHTQIIRLLLIRC